MNGISRVEDEENVTALDGMGEGVTVNGVSLVGELASAENVIFRGGVLNRGRFLPDVASAYEREVSSVWTLGNCLHILDLIPRPLPRGTHV